SGVAREEAARHHGDGEWGEAQTAESVEKPDQRGRVRGKFASWATGNAAECWARGSNRWLWPSGR
ncbi:hypothetical protein, partial [Salmonella enterica]|uniref:hypothetical protein n=1 Tax=Salmonella enterica TaxID=28901 RepID=UPI00398C5D6A